MGLELGVLTFVKSRYQSIGEDIIIRRKEKKSISGGRRTSGRAHV